VEELLKIDTGLCQGQKPNIDVNMFKNLGYIAGGAILRWFVGEPQNGDIDIFPNSLKNLELIQDDISKKLPYNPIIINNENAITYKNKIQIIKRHLSPYAVPYAVCYPPYDIVKEFDFYHCQFIWDGNDDYIQATPLAIITSLNKHLMINNMNRHKEMNTLKRAFKYCARGYLPCSKTLKTIIKSVSNINKENICRQMSEYISETIPNNDHDIFESRNILNTLSKWNKKICEKHMVEPIKYNDTTICPFCFMEAKNIKNNEINNKFEIIDFD
jgi:hypothetical protein